MKNILKTLVEIFVFVSMAIAIGGLFAVALTQVN